MMEKNIYRIPSLYSAAVYFPPNSSLFLKYIFFPCRDKEVSEKNGNKMYVSCHV